MIIEKLIWFIDWMSTLIDNNVVNEHNSFDSSLIMNMVGNLSENRKYALRALSHAFIEDHIDYLLKIDPEERIIFVQDTMILENRYHLDYDEIIYISKYNSTLDIYLKEVINENYNYGFFINLNKK